MQSLRFLAATALVIGAVASASADELVKKGTIPGEFSGSILLTNDYVFRGLSQTDDVPAIQGSVDWAHEIGPVGVHAGIWASNVKFTDASIEIDYTVGLGGSIDKFSWDVSGIYYSYPGADGDLNYDYWEVAPSLGYDFGLFSAKVGANFSPEYFGDSGDATYASFGVEIPIAKVVTLAANVGHQWIDDNVAWGTDDYVDWGVSISAEIEGFTFSVGWTDTDLDDSQCSDGDSCGLILFSVSRSF